MQKRAQRTNFRLNITDAGFLRSMSMQRSNRSFSDRPLRNENEYAKLKTLERRARRTAKLRGNRNSIARRDLDHE
jgi:hypothetical protein